MSKNTNEIYKIGLKEVLVCKNWQDEKEYFDLGDKISVVWESYDNNVEIKMEGCIICFSKYCMVLSYDKNHSIVIHFDRIRNIELLEKQYMELDD